MAKHAAIFLVTCLIAASLQAGATPANAADNSGNNNGNGNIGSGNGNGNSGTSNGNGNIGDLNGNNNGTDGNGNDNIGSGFGNGNAKSLYPGDAEGLPFAHFGRLHGRFHRGHRAGLHQFEWPE